MPINDLIDMERECSNPDCKHKRGAHGGTYYKRQCGVIQCVCLQFEEIKYRRTNTTWDGVLAEANRLDNANQVWQKRYNDAVAANVELRQDNAKFKTEAANRASNDYHVESSMLILGTENQALREELAKCQEVLDLLRAANKLPKHIGAWLLGESPEIEAENVLPDDDDDAEAYEDC